MVLRPDPNVEVKPVAPPHGFGVIVSWFTNFPLGAIKEESDILPKVFGGNLDESRTAGQLELPLRGLADDRAVVPTNDC
jgi:hypothetical protein